MLGLCLVAVFALAAVAAAGSASAAEPEWGHCIAQKHGNYTEGNCQTVATKHGVPSHKGGYEWLGGGGASCYAMKHGNYADSGCTTVATKHGLPDHKGHYEKTGGGHFTGVGGAGLLTAETYGCHTNTEEYIQAPAEDCNGHLGSSGPPNGYAHEGVESVECTGEHASGEATGGKEVANISVRFEGCTLFGFPAQTLGEPSGEIQVNPMKGQIGYINKATHEVGVLLEPVTTGGEFAEFEALGIVYVHVGEGNATQGSFYEETGPGVPSGHDGVISPITPVNLMTHTFTQNYRVEEFNQPCHVNCYASEDHANRNIPSHFEGGQLEALEMVSENREEEPYARTEWSPAGQEITNVNTVEGEAEIKA